MKNKGKIKLPVAMVFTKIDAFYPSLDRGNPIMASAGRSAPRTRKLDGQKRSTSTCGR